MRLRVGIVAATALLAGCKIVQTSTSGGSIVSTSGDYDCAEDSVCEIDIPNGDPFSESFTAVARYGYAFAGWRGTESYLCAGGSPTCVVDIPASVSAYDAMGFMTAEFYHQPALVYPGVLGIENNLWRANAFNDNIGLFFAADFDNDGDDDVLIAAETNPAEEFSGVRAGLILINDGDYSFTVAERDRPSSVGPREVMIADFDGDGMNDFFIADHGHDIDPFPGWSNQLLLWTADGYDDVSDRLPDDTTGFTHNAAAGDLDGDGDIDIVVANHGGEFRDESVSVLPASEFLMDPERGDHPISAAVRDFDGDGVRDILLGSYGGLQILINAGDRTFNDETRRRLGISAWSPDGLFHVRHRFVDFNRDGTLDIVPELYDIPNILAWLNDGGGHYVALRSTLFTDTDVLNQFALGLRIREGSGSKSVTFFGDGEVISADAGVVVTGAIITLAD